MMEPPKIDPPKLPDMVMCGDHPSITKTELNARVEKIEDKMMEKEKNKDKIPSFSKLSPSASRIDRLEARSNTTAASEHALRLIEARRRAQNMDSARASDASGNKALFQAALGSFRWPPYLVCIWVVVLLLTHALHCLVALLDSALPNLKKFCTYVRTWTEESWKNEYERSRMLPIALACLTGFLYTVYICLYSVHAVSVWAIEPLCDDTKFEDVEAKVTNYLEEVRSKPNLPHRPST